MGQSHETFPVDSESRHNNVPRLWSGARSLGGFVRKAYVGGDGSPVLAYAPSYEYSVNNTGVQPIEGQQMFEMKIE